MGICCTREEPNNTDTTTGTNSPRSIVPLNSQAEASLVPTEAPERISAAEAQASEDLEVRGRGGSVHLGGTHSADQNQALFNACTDFFSPQYKPVPGLNTYMFDPSGYGALDSTTSNFNLADGSLESEESMTSDGSPLIGGAALAAETRLHGMHSFIQLSVENQYYPKSVFLDTLCSESQSRSCGRYKVMKKIYNGRPCYYSKMSKMYLYALKSSNPSMSRDWAVAARIGGCSFSVLLRGGDMNTPSNIQKFQIFCYDKYSDSNHVRGQLASMGIIEGQKAGRASANRRENSQGIERYSDEIRKSFNTSDKTTGQDMFRSSLAEGAQFADISLDSYVECPDASLIPIMTKIDIQNYGRSDGEKQQLLQLQDAILQREWYIAKHAPVMVYKSSGAPTLTVGVYVPMISEFAALLPVEAQAVLDREMDHKRKRNPEENYLEFPKYHCAENNLFLFFNPAKCQWKVISSAEMHLRHAVKASSIHPTRVMFPIFTDWEEHYSVKVQFPSLESSTIDQLLEDELRIKLFTDTQFPATTDICFKAGEKVLPTTFYRAREIHDGNLPVNLFDNISPSDIAQGGLGDCWLLASLSVVAEYSAFLPRYVFKTKRCNLEGKYDMWLFDFSKKRWIDVTIDDYIPCYPKSAYAEMPIPRFSQPKGNEIWVLLLEKAFAKMCGGYFNLKAGYSGLAWIMLTGCMDYRRWVAETDVNTGYKVFRHRPIKRYSNVQGHHLGFDYEDKSSDDQILTSEQFVNYLREAERNNFLIGCVGVHPGAGGTEAIHSNGLVEGHAYGMLNIKDIPCLDGQTRTLLKLRNPWGDFHDWKGAFCDADEQSWSLVADRGRAYRCCEHDGTFWMSCIDFTEYYTHCDVLHFNMKTMEAENPMMMIPRPN